MLAADVRFEGFTYRDWARVLELFQPQRPGGRPRDLDRPDGGVVAVHDGRDLLKLVHSQVGRLRLDDLANDWPLSAEALARRHDCSWALKLERGALEEVMEAFGARARRSDTLTDQLLGLWSLIREQRMRGRIESWPARLQGMPLPSARMVDATLDIVCPPGKALLLGLFDEGELWTCVAMRRSVHGFDLVLGPDELRDELGLLSGDMRRDHRHLARAVAERIGPLSLGCFAERSVFRQLEVDPTPGAWALAVAVRDIVLHPVPPAVAVPLGLDAGRAAVEALRQVADRFDAAGVFGPALSALRDVALGRDEPGHEPGRFEPLELLRRLLTRER